MLSISGLSTRLAALNPATGGVYSTADLSVLLERSHPSRLTEAVRLLIREGVLARVRRGLYADCLHGYRSEYVGQRWVSPSYLSTETALDRHGLCETGIVPYTYVTTRILGSRTAARRRLHAHEFVYRHVDSRLFFGYESSDGVLLAHPEKAALDFLYFCHKGQRSVLSPEDVRFSRLNGLRYRRYLRRYRQRGFSDFALRWLSRKGGRR